MLPFPKDDGKRKFVCFVCGHSFLEFDQYKTHIVENHDEGREFVLCPLGRCGAPVRDVRAHYKAKHPNEKFVPKTGQMKAMIWKDQSVKGNLVKRKTKFREGYLVSAKNGGKELHYRSGMECSFYEILEQKKDVISYDVEPFKISYSFQGEPHEYNPDLIVNFVDGHTEIWEIKPSNQTHLPKNSAKWAACQSHCEARGWQFVVYTEIGLGKLKQELKVEK